MVDEIFSLAEFARVTGAPSDVLLRCAVELVLSARKEGDVIFFDGHLTQHAFEEHGTRGDLLAALMSRTNVADLTVEEGVLYHGLLIDTAGIHGDATGISHAIAIGKELLPQAMSAETRCCLDYQIANAVHARRLLTGNDPWAWTERDAVDEVLHLRLAVRSEAFSRLPTSNQCEILTNLANVFSFIGREVEAIEYWDRALVVDPGFCMALGNRGHGMAHFARFVYDESHRWLLLRQAHRDLSKALAGSLMPDASAGFDFSRRQIEALLTDEALHKDIDLDAGELGDTDEERAYRKWVLENRLFLTPMNELGVHWVAAHDAMTPPPITLKIDEGPGLVGLYNQLKQEFVSARFLGYQGLFRGVPHYSDSGVYLIDTLDHSAYGLRVELVKSAYRQAYSLFDRMAFFLNSYFRLGHADDGVSFRRVWGRKGTPDPALCRLKNWPLRGLYWLSRDLLDGSEEVQDTLEPDARGLADLRNALEHRYVKVTQVLAGAGELPPSTWRDRLATVVDRDTIEAQTLRLLKLARAAIIYLSQAVFVEEIRRDSEGEPRDVGCLPTSIVRDEWKR